ncbi:LppP/LprE family lipoprotein [Gordonia sp. VNK21]|uniref:LppP/LprE family lipoprotein n=1 Tax=Gordonia sp. VNK21 TaxID=3382483 RepID=UPI0038D4E739
MASAIERLPKPFPNRPEINWVQTGHGGSIDCTLNWVQVYSAGATGSSPTQIILFDHFKEAGTITKKPTAFTAVEPWVVPGQILVHFRWLNPGDPTANPTGSAYVRYQREEQRAPHPIDPLPRQAL